MWSIEETEGAIPNVLPAWQGQMHDSNSRWLPTAAAGMFEAAYGDIGRMIRSEEAVHVERYSRRQLARQEALEMVPGGRVLARHEEGSDELEADPHQIGRSTSMQRNAAIASSSSASRLFPSMPGLCGAPTAATPMKNSTLAFALAPRG